MGFIEPAPPPVDVEQWKREPYLSKLKPLAQDWAINGFGTPSVIFLLYVLKLVVFAVGGMLLIGLATPGLGGLGSFTEWWSEPIVWQKVVVWTVLWEFLGVGSGSMPLTLRFNPPIGGPLYWLRPGTLRLPPFPGRVPFTRGTTRGWLDVLLAAGLYASLIYLLVSGGEAVTDGDAVAIFGNVDAGRLDPAAIAVALGFMGLLGLRDKVTLMQTRPDVYAPLLVTFLFPLENMVIASQLVLVFVWIGAASSKFTHHFTYVVQVMVSNTPWNRSRRAKSRLYRDHPKSLLPSREAHIAAHTGTAIELAFPILLLLGDGGWLTTAAVALALVFHVHITSTLPMGVPLEWNLFMMFGIVWLFAEYASVPFSSLDSPVLVAIVVIAGLVIPTLGRLRPQSFSFLWAMLYYAGNWATSLWLFRRDGDIEGKVDDGITKSARFAQAQLVELYDEDTAELMLYKGLAFRAMHSHGRALNGLLPRLVDDVEGYAIRDGEIVAGALVGWNFGDGHFHDDQLLEAVQERLHLDDGDLRVVTLESQPTYMFRDSKQRYRLLDAKTGLIEEGWVRCREMTTREPWLDESGTIPVEVLQSAEQPPVDDDQREPAAAPG